MSYGDKVWKYLLKNGSITSKGIEDLTGTVCPHSVIRDIRKKYGADILTFENRVSKQKVIDDGKVKEKSKYFREWFIVRERIQASMV